MLRHLARIGTSLLLAACSSEIQLAPLAALPDSPSTTERQSAIVVPYPPPPARIEVVPPPPADSKCVWVDGQWAYNNQEYQWVSGAWVERPRGCAFARSRFFWDEAQTKATQLRYRNGRWVSQSPLFTECPPPAACRQAGP